MKIKRRSIKAVEEPEDEVIRWCPHCRGFQFQNKLTQLKDPNFFICQSCGQTFGRHEISIESTVKDFVEVSDNPFDSAPTIVGLGNKKPKNRREKDRQILLQRIDDEKDEEIKEALKKGNVVEIIENS